MIRRNGVGPVLTLLSLLLLCSCGENIFKPELPADVSMSLGSKITTQINYTEAVIEGFIIVSGNTEGYVMQLRKNISASVHFGRSYDSLSDIVKAEIGDKQDNSFNSIAFPFQANLKGLEDGAVYYFNVFASYGKSIISLEVPLKIVTLPNGPVDLDLPSGTLWASQNLGADRAEEHGDFYAWGETDVKKANGLYDWTNYLWCNGSYRKLTKYCPSMYYGYNGFVDNKTILEDEDDAVIKHLGGDWRTPSVQNWNELMENCQWAYRSYNGVDGYIVRSKRNTDDNKKMIFLPCTGYMGGANRQDYSSGLYWTNMSCTGFSCECAYYFASSSISVGIGEIAKAAGLPIRPVYVKQ